MATPPSSTAGSELSPPPNLPIGVRAPATITDPAPRASPFTGSPTRRRPGRPPGDPGVELHPGGDDDLPLPGGELVELEEDPAEGDVAAEQRRVVGEGGEDVEGRPPERGQLADQLGRLRLG